MKMSDPFPLHHVYLKFKRTLPLKGIMQDVRCEIDLQQFGSLKGWSTIGGPETCVFILVALAPCNCESLV